MIDNKPPDQVVLLRIEHALMTATFSLEAGHTQTAAKRVEKALELVRELQGKS